MELNTKITIDLEEVEKFLHSDEYINWLLNNTTDFTIAAFVLQAGFDALENARAQIDNE